MGEERKKEKDKRRELGNEAKSMNFRNWQLGHHFLLEWVETDPLGSLYT